MRWQALTLFTNLYTVASLSTCQVPSAADASYAVLSAASGVRNNDYGDFDSCLEGGFQYCTLSGGGVSIALCMPSSCGLSDVTNVTSPLWAGYIIELQLVWLPVLILTGGNIQISATCGDNSIPWGPGAVTTAVFLTCMAVAVLGATLYAMFVPAGPAQQKGHGVGQGARAGKATTLQGDKDNGPGKPSSEPWRRLDRVARGCSLLAVFPSLFGVDKPRPVKAGQADLTALDGVRVLSMCLVVFGHSVMGQLAAITNAIDVLRFSATAAGQVLPSAEFAVDSFFVLSGTLAAYLGVKQLAKTMPKGGQQRGTGDNDTETAAPLLANDELAGPGSDGSGGQAAGTTPKILVWCGSAWAVALVRRYLRLAPSLAVAIAITAWLGPAVVAGGPLGGQWSSSINPCRSDWWRTMLFVQNFAPNGRGPDGSMGQDFTQMCVDQSWYLATELQMFAVFVVPLCCLFVWSARAGWAAAVVSLAATTVSCFAVVWQRKLTFMFFPFGEQVLTGDYTTHFYVMPWTRAPPFLTGIMLGFALLQWEAKQRTAQEQRMKDGALEEDEVALGLEEAEDSSAMKASRASVVVRPVAEVMAMVLPARPGGKDVDWPATAALAGCMAALGVLFYLPSQAITGRYAQAGLEPSSLSGTQPWSADAEMFFTAVSKPAWGVALAGMLYLGATGRGGIVARGLGAGFWRPLAKLCYWTYLIHQFVIATIALSGRHAWTYTPFALAQTYIGNVVLSTLAAGVLYVLVEVPWGVLEKELWARG